MARSILVHTRNLSIPGGKQTYLQALQPHFQNHISYFYYGAPTSAKESKLDFIKRFFSDYIDFYRLIKKEKFDLVHINTSLNFKSYFRDSIFVLISKWLKVKTVVYWHGWVCDFEKKYARKIIPYFHFTFGKADTMICLASEFSDRLRAYRYNKPIYTETTVVEDSVLNHGYGLTLPEGDDNTKNILFLSRVEITKGIYETVDSFKNLKVKFPHLVLMIAGTGSELDKVKTYITENNIQDVQFLGWVDGKEKISALHRAHIFVLASYTEGMPICVLEAMVFGKPVVTTDIGAIKDFFEDYKMGLKVRPKDSKDLENKIEELLVDEELIRRIGANNRHYAKERFSAEQVCKRLEIIYERTITGQYL